MSRQIPTFYMNVKGGQFNRLDELTYQSIERMRQYIRTLKNGDYYLTIHPDSKNRTNQENRYYWGVVIDILYRELGWFTTPLEYHEYLKREFNGTLHTIRRQKTTNGEKTEIAEEIILPNSTAELDTSGFEDYLSKIRTWASIEADIYIPLPNEVYIKKELTE